MRTPAQNGDLSLHLMGGPHVVLLAMNWPEARRAELMGFAISRTNLQTGAGDFLFGQKSFPGATWRDQHERRHALLHAARAGAVFHLG
jgi:hypothetical protein